MFQPGQFVKHTGAPEWGTGRVAEVTADGKVRVQFARRQGYVLLTSEAAARLLDPSTGDDFGTAGRPQRKSQRGSKCEHCGTALNRSPRSQDRSWKSCPRCSESNGHQHVFYPFPDDFGVSEAKKAGGVEDGAQNYCIRCRGNNPPGEGRICQDVV